MKTMVAMKPMKAMKAMKAMKKTPISAALAKRRVFHGTMEKTPSGLTRADLKKNKNGRIVSKKKSQLGKKAALHLKAWTHAVKKARRELKYDDQRIFVAVNGKSPQGKALYKKAKELYKPEACRPTASSIGDELRFHK